MDSDLNNDQDWEFLEDHTTRDDLTEALVNLKVDQVTVTYNEDYSKSFYACEWKSKWPQCPFIVSTTQDPRTERFSVHTKGTHVHEEAEAQSTINVASVETENPPPMDGESCEQNKGGQGIGNTFAGRDGVETPYTQSTPYSNTIPRRRSICSCRKVPCN